MRTVDFVSNNVRSCRHLNICTLRSFILYSLLRIFIFRVRKEKEKLFYNTEYMKNIQVYTCISNCLRFQISKLTTQYCCGFALDANSVGKRNNTIILCHLIKVKLTKQQMRRGLHLIQYSRTIPEPQLTGIIGQAKLLYGEYTGTCYM